MRVDAVSENNTRSPTVTHGLPSMLTTVTILSPVTVARGTVINIASNSLPPTENAVTYARKRCTLPLKYAASDSQGIFSIDFAGQETRKREKVQALKEKQNKTNPPKKGQSRILYPGKLSFTTEMK